MPVIKHFEPFFISRLSARILAIMLLPLLLFFIGLFAIDQYRSVLIRAEFDALERQGQTLARTLAIIEANRKSAPQIDPDIEPKIDPKIDPKIASDGLSADTLRVLVPLVGYRMDVRARVFMTTGPLLADSAERGDSYALSYVTQAQAENMRDKLRIHITQIIDTCIALITNRENIPMMDLNSLRHANSFPDIHHAIKGEITRNLWHSPQGELVLSVSMPIQNLHMIKGGLLMTSTGGMLEREIAYVQWAFVQLFLGMLIVTILLGLYLARSITGPIISLARTVNAFRDMEAAALPRMPKRKDEIGYLATAIHDMTIELQTRLNATARFAADVAHEIKNLLTSLRSAIETFLRFENQTPQNRQDPQNSKNPQDHDSKIMNKDKERQGLMAVILADVMRLDRLISDIAQASRVDADMAAHPLEISDSTALLYHYSQHAQTRYSPTPIVFIPPENDVHETPKLMVKMHPARIIQILDNLLTNAVSFHEGEQAIEIRLKIKGQNICIEVADNGPGLPKNKEKIFDRFYSERPEKEGFGHHSGLGLSISRQIALAHGGTLTAMNRSDEAGEKRASLRPRKGAIFILTLPLI